MLKEIIIDTDICIKLGGNEKYRFLFDILPLVAEKIYMHRYTFSEVRIPNSANRQLNDLVRNGNVVLVSEQNLEKCDRVVYDLTYNALAKLMIDPARPNKNKGEVSSLAYAKTKQIPIFATDEKDLQPIIDYVLNIGTENDITCLRIVNIIEMARDGEIEIPRKVAKAIWRISGKQNEVFDSKIWPLSYNR